MRLEAWRPELPYSYAVGHFVALELLRLRPEAALRVLAHPDLAPERRAALEAACRRAGPGGAGLELEEDRAAVERLRRKGTVRALAAFARYPETLDPARDHVALVRPAQFGNVGTVLRTALAFGFRDVALIDARLDAFSPHLVRASLGARFGVACEAHPSLEAYLEAYPRALHPFALDGARDLDEIEFRSPFALAFGPEWPGLEPREAALGEPVRIPMGGEVESLNLAVAAGIALHAARRRA